MKSVFRNILIFGIFCFNATFSSVCLATENDVEFHNDVKNNIDIKLDSTSYEQKHIQEDKYDQEKNNSRITVQSNSIYISVNKKYKTIPPEIVNYDDGSYKGILTRQYISFSEGWYHSQYMRLVFRY